MDTHPNRKISVLKDANGCLHIFRMGWKQAADDGRAGSADHRIHTRSQSVPKGIWGDWKPFGDDTPIWNAAAGVDDMGRVAVSVTTTSLDQLVRFQVQPNGPWTDWNQRQYTQEGDNRRYTIPTPLHSLSILVTPDALSAPFMDNLHLESSSSPIVVVAPTGLDHAASDLTALPLGGECFAPDMTLETADLCKQKAYINLVDSAVGIVEGHAVDLAVTGLITFFLGVPLGLVAVVAVAAQGAWGVYQAHSTLETGLDVIRAHQEYTILSVRRNVIARGGRVTPNTGETGEIEETPNPNNQENQKKDLRMRCST